MPPSQINISNDGGAVANLMFTCKFQNTLAHNQIPGGDGGGRVFVGQRKDPSVVNLGETLVWRGLPGPLRRLHPNGSANRK